MDCNLCQKDNTSQIAESKKGSSCPFLGKTFQEDNLLQNLLINNTLPEIFGQFPFGLIKFSKQNKLLFLSKQAQNILGYSFAELEHITIEEFMAKIFPEDKSLDLTFLSDNQKCHHYKTLVNKYQEIINVHINCCRTSKEESLITIIDLKKIQGLETLQIQTQNILDSLSKIIVLFNEKDEVLHYNQALTRNFNIQKEIIGLKESQFYELIGLDHCQFPDNPAAEPFQVRINTDENSAEEKILLIELKPIYNSAKKYLGKIFIASDISSLIIRQEDCQQQEKLSVLGQMAAGIVHEVRNPLTAILGYAKLIGKKTKDEEISKFAEAIQVESTYLNKIVSDFLTFAKPQSPQLKKVALNDIVSSLAFILKSNSFLNDIELVYDLSPLAKEVYVDESQIRQVILNIVKNALDAMKDNEKKVLKLTTGFRNDTNESYLIIANNGKSIPQEELKFLGTPFFTTKEKGAGLGLSISYQIIKEHNARIEVKSGHKMGTLFKISFKSY